VLGVNTLYSPYQELELEHCANLTANSLSTSLSEFVTTECLPLTQNFTHSPKLCGLAPAGRRMPTAIPGCNIGMKDHRDTAIMAVRRFSSMTSVQHTPALTDRLRQREVRVHLRCRPRIYSGLPGRAGIGHSKASGVSQRAKRVVGHHASCAMSMNGVVRAKMRKPILDE
jgi:hypothetical protein